MKAIIAGLGTAVVFGYLSLFHILPFTFNLVRSTFETSDLGAILGWVAVLFVGSFLLSVGIMLSALVAGFASTYD